MTKTIDTSRFTEEQRSAFYAAFVAAGGVDDAEGNPDPWGCPWTWQPEITVEGETIEEQAASWFAQNRKEIESLLEEENAED